MVFAQLYDGLSLVVHKAEVALNVEVEVAGDGLSGLDFLFGLEAKPLYRAWKHGQRADYGTGYGLPAGQPAGGPEGYIDP